MLSDALERETVTMHRCETPTSNVADIVTLAPFLTLVLRDLCLLCKKLHVFFRNCFRVVRLLLDY